MGVRLVQDDDVADRILEMFASRGRRMPANNLRQALVPEGATTVADPQPGTAPGLICPVGDKVVYALPGVPYELQQIALGAVIPDLQRRSGQPAVIRSRTLRTWGESESGLAERLADHVRELDDVEGAGQVTLAYLASGIEGLKVRMTVKAGDEASAAAVLDAEEARLRELLGDLVFGVDAVAMEHAVAELLVKRGLTVAVAESLTGGLVAARLVNVPGASTWFRGGVVAYASEVKRSLLDVPDGPVVSAAAAHAMAIGVGARLEADIGLAVTGVAGPDPQDGEAPGTVFLAVTGLPSAAEQTAGAVAGPRAAPDSAGVPHVAGGHGMTVLGAGAQRVRDGEPGEVTVRVQLPGDRQRVRQFACISLLDLLRRQLLAR
jgi:nicotinamide-nucleotide amidase